MEESNNEQKEENKEEKTEEAKGKDKEKDTEEKKKPEEKNAKGKSSLGMDENVAALLSYVLGWITGIIMLVAEKESNFVRFHAMQSLVVFLAIFIIGMIPIIGWILNIILVPLGLILWILLMYKAYQGEKFKLPIAGNFAESQIYGDEKK